MSCTRHNKIRVCAGVARRRLVAVAGTMAIVLSMVQELRCVLVKLPLFCSYLSQRIGSFMVDIVCLSWVSWPR